MAASAHASTPIRSDRATTDTVGGIRRGLNALRVSVAAMAWPRDDAKLERVRALMAEEDLDALVVRAPDNVLYLSNFLPMKGYDVVVFPREGEQTLICLEPSL